MVFFGQVVIGPPGAGKTTYCNGMQQMCNALQRKVVVVNLDPANDELPYDCGIDVRDLVSIEDVMEEHRLGPNGALMYAMEYLLANLDWLESRLKQFPEHYILMDLPGQVELYTHHSALLQVLENLQKSLDARPSVDGCPPHRQHPVLGCSKVY